MRIENHVDPAGIFIFAQNFCPGFATVARAKNSALFIWTEGVSKRRHQRDVLVSGIDNDGADVVGVFQSNIFPTLAGVDRFINARSVSRVPANRRFAGADINHIVIGRRDRDCADR